MTDQKRPLVGAETLLAIQEGNKQVIKEVSEKISESNENIKEFIEGKIDPMKIDIERLRDGQKDLYDKDREVREKIYILESKVSGDEGNTQGRDIAEEKNNRKSEIKWGVIGVLISFGAVFGGVIGFLLKNLKG